MQDWVRWRLDRIEELYSPERVAAGRRRWTDIWSGRFPEDRLPFVELSHCVQYYDDLNAPAENDQRLSGLLDECILHGLLKDDFIPALFPGCRQSTIPNMFGIEEIVVDHDFTCARLPVTPEAIDALPEPAIRPGSVARQWLDRQAEWLEKTEGRLPINVVDMQGPMDAAAQVFGYDGLFLLAYTDRERFDRIMGLFSDAFVMFWGAQKELLGDLFVPTHLFGFNWVPPNTCATLSADCLVMLSPDFFAEFLKPSLDRISTAFGGVAVHSCGDFSHLVRSLHQLHDLRGINASQLSLEQLQAAGLRTDVVAIFLSDFDTALREFDLIRETGQLAQVTVQSAPVEIAVKPGRDWSAADFACVAARHDRLLEKLELC
jgi:hypothetical protein